MRFLKDFLFGSGRLYLTTADVNTPNATDIPAEVWPEGDLPSQGGGFTPTLMPGVSEFSFPPTIEQLWTPKLIKDNREKLADGSANPTFGKEVPRWQLKFDKANPLVIASGPHKGETLTATFSTAPKRRGKPDDEKAPWISDLAYMLDIALNDKSRPSTAEALKAKIIAHAKAGHTIRIEHGLSAQCRPDKVRYIISGVPNPAFNPAMPATEVGGANAQYLSETTVQDPSGTKGCNDDSKKREDNPKRKKGRFYTDDFKDPTTGEYMDTIDCNCGAVLRGFPSVERFAPPLGVSK